MSNQKVYIISITNSSSSIILFQDIENAGYNYLMSPNSQPWTPTALCFPWCSNNTEVIQKAHAYYKITDSNTEVFMYYVFQDYNENIIKYSTDTLNPYDNAQQVVSDASIACNKNIVIGSDCSVTVSNA